MQKKRVKKHESSDYIKQVKLQRKDSINYTSEKGMLTTLYRKASLDRNNSLFEATLVKKKATELCTDKVAPQSWWTLKKKDQNTEKASHIINTDKNNFDTERGLSDSKTDMQSPLGKILSSGMSEHSSLKQTDSLKCTDEELKSINDSSDVIIEVTEQSQD